MKRILIPLMLFLAALSGLGAASYYDTGSQIFTITAGVSTPMSYTSHGESMFWPGSGEGQTHHTVGGIGALSYQIFVTPYLAIGGELGYQFNYIAGTDIYASVPINVKVSYYPVQTGRFDLPISLGIGLNYISFKDSSKLSFSAKIEFGGIYYFNDEWGLGLLVGLNFAPDVYLTKDRGIYSGIDAFIPITVSVAYRH